MAPTTTGPVVYDYSTWPGSWYVAYPIIIFLGFEVIHHIPHLLCGVCCNDKQIEDRAPRLKEFSWLDWSAVTFSKAVTIAFVYHLVQYASYSSTVVTDMAEASLLNTLLPVPFIFLIYDFTYTLFHWFLHIRAVYWLVHKHHHRNMTCFRGNRDAINVHPFEYVSGEYNHILAIHVFSTYVFRIHMLAMVIFMVIGGLLATLNHTRYDWNIPGCYSVKNHDVHHRKPMKNFGQYTIFWDKVFGTYQSYEDSCGKKGSGRRKSKKS